MKVEFLIYMNSDTYYFTHNNLNVKVVKSSTVNSISKCEDDIDWVVNYHTN